MKDPNQYTLPFSDRIGRVDPPYLTQRTTPLAASPSLEHGPRIDTTFDHDARQHIVEDGLNNGEYPEVSPAMAGLRRFVTERRIGITQARAEYLAGRGDVLRFVGEAIQSQKPYMAFYSPFNPDKDHPTPNLRRPTGLRNKVMVGTLENVNNFNDHSNMRAGNLVSTHPDIEGSKQTFMPFYNQYDKTKVRLSWSERRAMGKAARHYRRNMRFSKAGGKTFDFITAGPNQRAEKRLDKRDRLVLKSDALAVQAQTNKVARKVKYDTAKTKIHAAVSKSRVVTKARESLDRTKKAIKKIRK
jgi:hypothetical protein